MTGLVWLDVAGLAALAVALTAATRDGRRARNALRLIARNGCENYTGRSTCRDNSGRTRDARYGAEKWCDACIALDVLTPRRTRQDTAQDGRREER